MEQSIQIGINLKVEKRLVKNHGRRSNKNRIYIFNSGETIIENLVERHYRPVEFYKQVIIPHLIAQGFLNKDSDIKWSQKAGCSCPCSPGFIVESEYGYEIFVTSEQTVMIGEPKKSSEAAQKKPNKDWNRKVPRGDIPFGNGLTPVAAVKINVKERSTPWPTN